MRNFTFEIFSSDSSREKDRTRRKTWTLWCRQTLKKFDSVTICDESDCPLLGRVSTLKWTVMRFFKLAKTASSALLSRRPSNGSSFKLQSVKLNLKSSANPRDTKSLETCEGTDVATVFKGISATWTVTSGIVQKALHGQQGCGVICQVWAARYCIACLQFIWSNRIVHWKVPCAFVQCIAIDIKGTG